MSACIVSLVIITRDFPLISDQFSSPAPALPMAARSISSRQTGGSGSYSLTRSQGSLPSPRAGYSFSSGYTTTGFSFSSYISSSASSYSSLASPTPVVLRRKTSGLSREEYKTRSKSVDASQIYEAVEAERHKTPTSLERSLSTERLRARKSSVFGAPDRSRECSVGPDPELGDNIEEKIRTKPVRNRQSHGVSQYDLERAATWAMIGSNKPQGAVETPRGQKSTETVNTNSGNKESQIDYKKVNLYIFTIN